ncbi:uncharacterized protein LOC121415136 [Lytechinus variegatus]|uniref:uncharacterized protein LOC121415136 n=1 Tax=Lytechinus variegatus TaxID=7654 RepID=UPI001BB1AC27|nr:uncharacterized protein LOC121415136 [Lytechinus variegatus]
MFAGRRKHLELVILMMFIINEMKNFTEAAGPLPMPNGIRFLGIGYNILTGNPEGGDLSSGGVDPGLLVTRKFFQMTNKKNKLSHNNKYRIPDQVVFEPRDSAKTDHSKKTFYGAASYASKLSANVEVTGTYSGVLAKVQFAASTRYGKIKKDTRSRGFVYFSKETISNFGQARLQLDSADDDDFGLDNGFVSAACELPNAYDESKYMPFIDQWGTHVVTEVNLGIREGEIYKEERSAFVNYASTNIGGSVQASGEYNGFSASLSVNMDSFNSGMKNETKFGSSYSKYKVGSKELNEPISIKLIGIHDIFDKKYWKRMPNYIREGRCNSGFQIASVSTNMVKALKGYAAYRKIQAPEDSPIKIPLTWPEGTYALQKPRTGCPNKEFKWNEGFRFHDTENSDSKNSWSDPLSIAGHWGKSSIRQEFCVKTVTTVNPRAQWTWQPGSYCIYKYGDCPKGFESGWIYWDDEDSDNGNTYGGVMPSGEYGANTKLFFCCRNDGVTTNKINLPLDNKFYLFPRFDHCQEVNGTTVSKERFTWDTADSTYWGGKNTDSQSAIHPYYGKKTTGGSYITLYFCYYQPDNSST